MHSSFFDLLCVSVSDMNIVQTCKLCVNFRVHDSFCDLKRLSHYSCSDCQTAVKMRLQWVVNENVRYCLN